MQKIWTVELPHQRDLKHGTCVLSTTGKVGSLPQALELSSCRLTAGRPSALGQHTRGWLWLLLCPREMGSGLSPTLPEATLLTPLVRRPLN